MIEVALQYHFLHIILKEDFLMGNWPTCGEQLCPCVHMAPPFEEVLKGFPESHRHAVDQDNVLASPNRVKHEANNTLGTTGTNLTK